MKRGGRWYWDGAEAKTPMFVTDWTAGQPDNLTGDQNCLSLFYRSYSPNLQWGDGRCTVKLNFICEKYVGADVIGK